MSASSLDTLFLPLEMGLCPMGDKTLFLGAAYHPFLKNMKDVHCVQPFKPLVDDLQAHKIDVIDSVAKDYEYDLVIIHCPKQVEEAQYCIAYGLQHLAQGGNLLIAAGNDSGGGRLEGWLKQAGMTTESLSKHKGRAVWGVRPKFAAMDVLEKWQEQGQIKDIKFGDGLILKSQPGLFSWDRLDKGSSFLIENFSSDLKGKGADFGAGIGVLSHALISTKHTIECIHVVEADNRALACARKNIEGVNNAVHIEFHWHDLTKPLMNISPLDFVVMNPPFHTAKKNDIALGVQFIHNASYILRKGGVLLMVANIHLPYESRLKNLFSKFDIIGQKYGFKIIRAVK